MKLHAVVLEHAAAFIGRTPWDVSRDADLLAAAQIAAYRVYGQQPITCGIDVYNVEAEAWGAQVETHDPLGAPVLGNPLFSDLGPILDLPTLDLERDGRLPMLLAAARKIAAELPDAPLRIPLAGPFSIAVALMGFETLLMEMLDNEEAVQKALQKLGEHQAHLCAQIAERGFQTTIYESGAAPPLVSPEMFSALVAPALIPILEAGRKVGKPVACIIGGDIAPIVEKLLECRPAAVICPAETDQEQFMRKAANWPDIAVRMNLPAGLMASGDEAALQREIERLSPLARLHPLGSLGTGVLPYDSRPEAVLALSRFAESLDD